MHICVHVWRPEVTYRILPQLLSILIFQDRISHTEPGPHHFSYTGWLLSFGDLPVHSQCWAYRWHQTCSFYMRVLRSELRSSCFHNTTHWTTTIHISGFLFCFFFFLRAQEGKFRWPHEVCDCLLACLFVHMLRSHSVAYYGLEFRIQYVSPPAEFSDFRHVPPCLIFCGYLLMLFFFLYAFVYVTLGQGLGCILCLSRWWAKLTSLALGVLPC